MTRFTKHIEPWGQFVDVKINSPDILEKELKRAQKGVVFMSSICDGWQQIERKYRLSRQCLHLLVNNGFQVNILTKSVNVRDDFDTIRQGNVHLGVTITVMDDSLCRKIEPGASITRNRIRLLQDAADNGIKTWAFIGPFMPFLSDNMENIDAIFESLSKIKLDHVYFDQLNLRSGVWQSIKNFLSTSYPHLLGSYSKLLYDQSRREAYKEDIERLILKSADKYAIKIMS